MAVDFSKFNFFNRFDARARILVLVASVAAIVIFIYLLSRFLGGDATGPTKVASAPSGLQSIQGGTTTPLYQRTLEEQNVLRAQTAKMTAGSSVATPINYGNLGTPNCNIICSDQNANVKPLLDDWQRQGQITADIASQLQSLADQNVPVDQYAAELARLVKEGKLTPEQARELLEQYKKQHDNNLLQESAKVMDGMIKNGDLPLDAANQLLTAQKNKVTPSQYAALLQKLVDEGKLSPAAAQQLLAQYTQQRAREIVMQSVVELQKMAAQGLIIPEVLKSLIDLENRMIPTSDFDAALQKYISAGQLTPAAAKKILDEYKKQKAEIGTASSVAALLAKATEDAANEISDLLAKGKISQDVANQLRDMIQRDVSLDTFKAALAQLVQQNKMTPDIAQLKLADYLKIKGLRDLSQQLATLEGNNASFDDYGNALKKAVADGAITPDQAAQLMREYQAVKAAPVTAPAPAATPAFAQLQAAAAAGAPPPEVTTTQFQAPAAAPPAQVTTTTTTTVDPNQQARIQALMQAMQGQAGNLINAWQPAIQEIRVGNFELPGTTKTTVVTTDGKGGTTSVAGLAGMRPIIKAGTILFAVLDTTANSDYPDSPIMATIVAGPFKGAKLLGKLVTTKGVAGQLDRIALNFTLMNMEQWPKSVPVNSYAIDPDTARNVMASSVNYHYLLRYGAIMATSFLQGYATAITTSSSTSTTGIFGTSTTHPALDPRQKLFVALGQIGQNLGAVTQNFINIPPTVKVDAGVGLGILFMADVTPGETSTPGQIPLAASAPTTVTTTTPAATTVVATQ